MSLRVYVSHAGQCIQADPEQVISTEALRQWISDQTKIPPSNQILMTARGKSVKQQHLSTEQEIFLYDKHYFAGDVQAPSASNRPKPVLRRLRDPPSTITNENSLQSWQELFMARRTWALEAVDIVRSGADTAQTYNEEIDVITRSTTVALENLKNHVNTLQHKFENTQKWARDVLEEHRAALNDWKAHLDVLREIPVKDEVLSILQHPSTPTKNKIGKANTSGALSDLADVEQLEADSMTLSEATEMFEQKTRDLQDQMKRFHEEAIAAEKYGQTSWNGSETAIGLIEESETLAKKISSDYEETLRFRNDQKSIATASRRALTHTRDFLPTIKALIDEVHQLQTSSVIRRNEAAENCVQALRAIASLESRLVGLQGQVTALDVDNKGSEALEAINWVFQLPVVYGSTLVEAVRRTDWLRSVTGQILSLRDEIQAIRGDEIRRRQKWAKSIGEYFLEDRSHEDDLVDADLSTPTGTWPEVTKDQVQAYIEDLKALQIDDAVGEVIILMSNLESRQKTRRPSLKAFKNGSVHDLANSSTLHDTVDEVKTLQDDKVRLEDKLRASDSRVRKLEDLLHRQSQMARQTSSAFGGPPDFDRNAATSPSPVSRPVDQLSRRSSVTSRRLSNQTLDNKELVQRIVSLEAEIARLKQEAHEVRRSSTEVRGKMEEAESVKRDLMANFESQKQEFDDERQLLEDEAQKLKIRIEEIEDELDRMAGSRDHHKIRGDEIIHDLQAELDGLRRAAQEQDNHARIQRERASALEKQVQQHREERSALHAQNLSLANQLRDTDQGYQDHIASLQAVHANLSPQGSAPDDFKKIVRALEILSEGSAIHVRGQDDALRLAMLEIRSLEERLAVAEEQVKRLENRLSSAEDNSASLRETLAEERGQLKSVRGELADEGTELRTLRAKFAAGETGSEALRERLVEEEKKVAELSQRAATAEAIVQNAAAEVKSLKAKAEDAADREHSLVGRLDARGSRAKDLSQRLLQQNDRMVRMLEHMGYSVMRQEERLVVQRASKVNATSTTFSQSYMADASAMMKRTISGGFPTQHYSDAAELDTLYWMSDTDADNEDSKFQRFVSALSRLDLDGSVELITKRYKDVETLAKKYQKDSRAYREKSHRLQSDAHEKIAYRGFKEGDLALFLPTRNQATRPWAAFNVGAPHYFLREQDAHKLQTRDWLLARISKIEERVVDLSRSLGSNRPNDQGSQAGDGASVRSIDDENPFELSDGLRWYLIDASEEKPGAPSTPGLAKSTVAASNVEVKGSMGKRVDKPGRSDSNAANMVTKTLNKSLDSRRSSTGSKQGGGHSKSPSISNAEATKVLVPVTHEDHIEQATGSSNTAVRPADADLRSDRPPREDAKVFEVDGRQHDTSRKENMSALPRERRDVASPVKTSGELQARGQESSRTSSPVKPGAGTPAKAKPWDKLWGLEYRMEERG